MLEEKSFSIKVYAIEEYVHKGKRAGGGKTYNVRWRVATKNFKSPFRTKALADSFRSTLVAAQGKGEAFRIADGLPVSAARAASKMSWYDFACKFVDMKWPGVAATTRRTHAEALAKVTPAMYSTAKGKPDDKLLRKALQRYAFNTTKRLADDMPEDIRLALKWVAENTRPVSALQDPQVLRPLLDCLLVKLDGKPYAGSVVSRHKKIVNTALEYGVTELKLLDVNPIPALKWTAAPRKAVQAIDPRRVANAEQAGLLIKAVGEQGESGELLEAFFGALYECLLRPEEAAALTKDQLKLPEKGWGKILLQDARPYAGSEWTDDGEARDKRGLKQRDPGTIRVVLVPPTQTARFHAHIAKFGTTKDGRLFRGVRNTEELPKYTVLRVWRAARVAALSAELVETDLAASPYDMRHAGISLFISLRISPARVAEMAGHSLEILFRIYAHVLAETDEGIQGLIEGALSAAA
ncbi:integrase [Lentzea sp. JNUCC 0626]|uniref:integrase n=1 Tax=Lentzea sp. JNUCC 0626 TaxID=3367513 RepID=UPI00374A2EF7